jgi:CBS domain-containing protein
MRTVKTILKSKHDIFNTISPDVLVIDALNMLNSLNLSYLVVTDFDSYKGIFSERDYSRNVLLKGRSSSRTKVEEVMTTDLPIVHLADTLEQCMYMINLYKTSYLLAYDNHQLAGIISIQDLVHQVLVMNKIQEYNFIPG